MPTFKEDHKLGTMVPLIKTDDLNDGCIDYSKLDDILKSIITGGGGGGSVNLSAYLKKSEAEALYVKKDEIPSGTTIGVITNSEIDTLFE